MNDPRQTNHKRGLSLKATAPFSLHIFQSSDFLFRTDAFVSECFYDDEHHGDEEDAEDGGDGRTENDGNPHSDSA